MIKEKNSKTTKKVPAASEKQNNVKKLNFLEDIQQQKKNLMNKKREPKKLHRIHNV
jgi:hypothetical protein